MSESTVRVIQKLLSRAEATEFDSERESCLAKVAELMARYSIEEAVLAAASETPSGAAGRPIERLMVVPSPYAARKVSLFAAVGSNCGCTVIDLGNDDSATRRVAVIGFAGDVDRAEVLITSLLVQMARSMLGDRSGGGRSRTPGSTAAWRRSFITGFTIRVGDRLAEARRREARRATRASHGDADRTGSPSVALVLAQREQEVDTEVRRRYPHLRTSRMDAGSSEQGHRAGTHAGDRADIGAPAVSRRRALQA